MGIIDDDHYAQVPYQLHIAPYLREVRVRLACVEELQRQGLGFKNEQYYLDMKRKFYLATVSADGLKVSSQAVCSSMSENYDPKQSVRSLAMAARWRSCLNFSKQHFPAIYSWSACRPATPTFPKRNAQHSGDLRRHRSLRGPQPGLLAQVLRLDDGARVAQLWLGFGTLLTSTDYTKNNLL